jgi:hypothetical protein
MKFTDVSEVVSASIIGEITTIQKTAVFILAAVKT